MKNNPEKDEINDWLKDLPVRAEISAFDAEQMIECKKCLRKNPPNRLNCLYCGAELEISDLQNELIKPVQRKLEIWEKGFNLIRLSNFAETNFKEAAKFTNFEAEKLRRICETDAKLPLVRLDSEKAAQIVQKNLEKCGIETRLLSDENLAAENANRRLRGIEFLEDKIVLILFNADEIYEMPFENIALFVTGILFERKIDSKEKRVKKGENKVLESFEMSSDEMLIDVYDKENPVGFRILSKGFDFSCLGAEKGILAIGNMKNLLKKLREIARHAKISDDYLKNREYLSEIWEIEYHNSKGLRTEGLRLSIGSSETTSNLSQFNKYSRLQWHIK